MSDIRAERNGDIGVITINRATRFNAMDVETARDFRRAALGYARDDTVRVVLLKGQPGVFCSGADLKCIRDGGDRGGQEYLAPGSRSGGYGETFKQILEYIHSAISEIRRAPKPFIAAVDGVAAAGGLGIAMSCDLVLASTRATFEWAYSRTGLTGAESTTFFLPRLVGLRRAMELVLLNPRLTATQAHSYGLVTAVSDTAGFDAHVMDVARQVSAGPPHAYAISKELLNQAAGMDGLDDHLDRELAELTRAADGEEFAQGLQAFFAKTPARFG